MAMLIGLSSSVGYNLLEGLALQFQSQIYWKKIKLAAVVLESVWAMSCIYSSWIRVKNEVESIFSKTIRLLRFLLYLAPFIIIGLPMIIHFICAFSPAFQHSTALAIMIFATSAKITAALLFLTLDCVDPRLLLISRFWCVTCMLCLIALGADVAYSIALVKGVGEGCLGMMVVALVGASSAGCVHAVLFVKKVVLWRQRRNEILEAKEKIEKAKLPLTMEVAILDSICSKDAYFTIDQIFSFLKSNVHIDTYLSEFMATCSESAHLSWDASDPAALKWFFAANTTNQNHAIQKICNDWGQSPPTVIKMYATMAMNAPAGGMTENVKTEMGKCPAVFVYQNSLTAEFYTYVSLAVLTVVMLGVFSWFVFNRFVPTDEFSWKHIATPFNISFYLGMVSVLIVDVLYAINMKQAVLDEYSTFVTHGSLWYTDDSERNALFVAIQFFQSVWACSYLFFSAKRSEHQLKTTFPKTNKIITRLFQLSPLTILSPIPLSILQVIYPTHGWTGNNVYPQCASALTLMILDVIFIASFAKFLARTALDGILTVQPQFKLICKFGIFSSFACVVMAGVSIFLATVTLDVDFVTMARFTMLNNLLMHFVMMMMVCLKIGLYQIAVSEHSRRLNLANPDSTLKGTKRGKESTNVSVNASESGETKDLWWFVSRYVNE
ncbi:hypothetical protein HDU98_010504 [Podochytrium sp. JEL0797]|nr:hypothetical protein HDU98_010504 [Podochytrium sp. JEL0797]